MAEPKVYNGYEYTQQPDGSWKRGRPVQQQQPIAPVDPRIQPSVNQAEANTRQTNVRTNVEERTAPAEVATATLPPGYMWVDPSNPGAGVRLIPGYEPQTEKEKGVDPLKLSQFRALEQQIARVEELYNAGPGSTKGVAGFQDYIPTDANAAFDSAAAGLGEVGLAAFRVPGVGAQSDAELRQFVAANTPSASDRDSAIREKLGNLRRRLEATKEELGLNAPANTGEPPKAAGVGATETAVPLPEGYQGSLRDLERGLYTGAITLEDYARGRVALDRQSFGDEAQDRYLDYLEEGYQRQRVFEQGATPDDLPPVGPGSRQMSSFERMRNEVASDPFGTGVINYLDAAGLGGVSALAGDQMQAANALNPNAALIGQIGGAVTGTGLMGAAGRRTLAQRFPALMGGGGKGQFARNLGTDLAYGTTYGVNTGMSAEDAALSSGGGSVGGQVLGKTIGKAFSGADVGAAQQYLRDRGIPLTVGQTLGGPVKAIEDAASSVPFVGDMIGRRYDDSLRAMNRAALEDAGQSIGFNPNRVGRAGVEDLMGDANTGAQGAVGRAYDNATAGFSANLDVPYGQDIANIQALADKLPPDAIPSLNKIGENYVQPILDSGQMTGDVFQNTQRALKMKRGKPPVGAQGFEDEWRNAISGISDANRDFVIRQGGQDVATGLANADRSYRLGKIVQDAAQRADGNDYVFTASQLQDAIKSSNRKFPGETPLIQLADNAQQVLPSRLPDSGTGRRVMQGALGGLALGGLGIGETYATGDADSTSKLAAALALLSAGGTRSGQAALNSLLTKRPETLDKIGQLFSRKSGLFGSAFVPIALESSR